MKPNCHPLLTVIVILLTVLSACSVLPGSPSEAQPPASQATNTADLEIPVTSELLPTETRQPEPTVTVILPTEAPTEAPTIEPTLAPTEIVHVTIPGTPAYIGSQLLQECNTGYIYSTVSYKIPQACDAPRLSLLERPLSADHATFYPFLDILSAQFGAAGEWFFTRIDVFEASLPADGTPLTYYLELDLNFNGRGDFLLAVENLPYNATEWTVAGVRAWKDTNGDVGSASPLQADAVQGDGYETLLFDQGIGTDPDLVWAKRSTSNFNRIELAFKGSLLEGKTSFLWWTGSRLGEFNPAAFDLVDGIDTSTLYQVDTTCGWAYGASSKGLPKQCYFAEPTAVPVVNSNPPGDVCVKPPHPNPQDGCWIWNEKDCKWECWN